MSSGNSGDMGRFSEARIGEGERGAETPVEGGASANEASGSVASLSSGAHLPT